MGDGGTAGDDEAAAMMRKMGVELPGEEKSQVGVAWNKVEKKKEMSRAEKEMVFIVKNIADRLGHLNPEARYEITKGLCGIFTFLSLVLGTALVLKGFALTVIFASDDPDINFVIAGAAFAAPCVVWFTYIFILPCIPCGPCRRMHEQRTSILEQRSDRKKPSLFNEMVASANEHSQPPIIRTPLYAMFRKKEYKVVCHTMEEFQEIFYFRTGVPPERQLLKLREPDGSAEVFEFKPEEFVLDLEHRGVRKNTMFWIYTKGGYENEILTKPELRMEIARKGGSPTSKLLKDGVNRYARDMTKKDAVDEELDQLMASPPGSPNRPGTGGAGGGFIDAFYPGRADDEESDAASFRVTKKKRGKTAWNGTTSIYTDVKDVPMPEVDEDFLEDIEKVRANRNPRKYPQQLVIGDENV
jgi:hypothetical protein